MEILRVAKNLEWVMLHSQWLYVLLLLPLLQGFIRCVLMTLLGILYQMGSVYIWTYVYNLMRVLSSSPIENQHSVESNYDSCKVPLIASKEEEEEDNHKVSSLDQ